MSEALGLSIGTTNLAAATVGRQPVIRRSVLTLYGHTAPEVGAATGRPGGLVLSEFVERVGDPVPLVAADGSSYPAEQLVVEALESMAGLAAPDAPSDVAISVPSYWSARATAALAGALQASAVLTPGGTLPRLIPDADAALTALNADPGLDRRGVVALLDLGGGGTSITLADAASAFTPIGDTQRFAEFAGDQIDQAVLSHVLAGLGEGTGGLDPDQTAAVGSLAALREQCRAAKERLSLQTATDLPVDLPGYRGDVRLTRGELEELIARPLDGVFVALEQALARNSIGTVSSVALVGGGSAIPLVAQQVSQRFRVPVVTTPRPALDAAAGAALVAAYGRSAETMTVATVEADSTYALAWSQDDLRDDDIVPFTGEIPEERPNPYALSGEYETEVIAPDDRDAVAGPGSRLPLSLTGLVAAVALLAVGGAAIALTSLDSPEPNRPTPGNVPLSSALVPSPEPPPVQTVTQQPVQPPPTAEPPAPVAPPVVTTPPAPVPTTTTPTTTTTTTTTTT
ncbi:Hsp70 family protein, partial [Mycolicibacterium vaccae]